MRLGYACTNMTLGYSVRELRLATLRAHGLPAVQALLDQNMATLTDILRWNRAHGITMYRIPANLVPFGNHAEVDLDRLDFAGAREIPDLARGMRLSVHPGHFTLLSAAGEVWERSRQDLLYHATLFDILGIDGDITIHGGGVYGDRGGTAALPWARIAATWRARLPKLHYSEQDPVKKLGAHSAYVDVAAFRRFVAGVGLDDFDVMLECKAKEVALLRLREELGSVDGDGRGDASGSVGVA